MRRFNVFFTTIMTLGVTCAANAQTIGDALKYTNDDYIGTARTMAVANAVTATGGDMGTVAINPAGAAVAPYSQFTISPAINMSFNICRGTSLPGANAAYSYGNRVIEYKSRFVLPNLSLNYNYETGRPYGIKSMSFGFHVNTKSFYQDYAHASGIHKGTSLSGFLASQANGIDFNQLNGEDAFNMLPTNVVLAWKSGMISTTDLSDQYVGAAEKFTDSDSGERSFFVPGELNQKFKRQILGKKTDYTLNYGMNISDKFYWGVSLVASDFAYSYDEFQSETPVEQERFDVDFGAAGSTYFSNLEYKNWYTTRGRGYYAKFGVIYTPGIFRIGAAIQTPTRYYLTDTYGSSASCNFENYSFNGYASAPEGEFRYTMSSPWKANIGVAATFASSVLVSADYELMSNKLIRFMNRNFNEDSFSLLNSDIKNCLGSNHQFRLGVDYKTTDILSLRAGYALNSVVSGGKEIDGDSYVSVKRRADNTHAVSLGFGISTRGSMFFDFAYRCLFSPREYIYPYGDYDFDESGKLLNLSPEFSNMHYLHTVVFTLGFRF